MSHIPDDNYLSFLESKEYMNYVKEIETYKMDSYYRAFLQSEEYKEYQRENLLYINNFS